MFGKCKHKKVIISSFEVINNPPFNDSYFYCKCVKCKGRSEMLWIKFDNLKKLLNYQLQFEYLQEKQIKELLHFPSQQNSEIIGA